MYKTYFKAILFMTAFAFLLPSEGFAQKKKKKKGAEVEVAPAPDEIEALLKTCNSHEGLFDFYSDSTSAKNYMVIRKDQLNKEFIYFSYSENGVVSSGHYRGGYRNGKIISIEKYFDSIEIYRENTTYYFDESNEVSKAKDANINRPLMASEKILAQNDSLYIISADALLLSEKLDMIKYPGRPGAPSFLGNLSKSKTKISKINNYPENSEITVNYVYDNPAPRFGGGGDVTDARYITVVFQHSFLEVPENNFVPRKDDGRIGFFSTQITDLTSFDYAPYKDLIHRWHLEKKDPNAELSEPVEPIVYWIENTTPMAFRPIIKEGVERWNIAFEKAGFKNAIVAKIQPDTAEWDAGDIRYNVIRWTATPKPIFGGYGPSFVNPRTGQILGADIMLEYSSLGNRLKKKDIMGQSSTEDEAQLHPETPHQCSIGMHMQHNMMFANAAFSTMDSDELSEDEFIRQTLFRLTLHEVGHTLGMSHNMHGTTLQSVENIKNKEIVDAEGLSNSVMDYPSINYALNPEEQTLYYDVYPGIYDHWVIEYGYSQALENEEEEDKRLDDILSRSHDPRLAFGNDADDMRAPGKGMDPNVNIYDLSNDPVAYASERCELIRKVLPELKDKYSEEGNTYQDLTGSFGAVMGEYNIQLGVMTRQIGGVHIDRSVVGQGSENMPLEPVSLERQKEAMAALSKYAFAADAIQMPDSLLNYSLAQRRGFNHGSNPPNPKVHSSILNMQNSCFNHLLHPRVMARIIDSEMYGNEYSIDAFMMDLTNAVFEEDLRKSVNSQRQNLQILYVKRLSRIVAVKSMHDELSKAMAWSELERIDKMMQNAYSPDNRTKAHRNYVRRLIKNLDELAR